MIENLPAYVSVTFTLTTFLTVGFFLYAIRQGAFQALPAKILISLTAFWLLFQAVMALGGFYTQTGFFPPRIVILGVFPVLLLIIAYFLFFRASFIERLPLKLLTILHVIRIPVEITLFWLLQNRLVPEAMTFEGRNFDILSGLTAPIVFWLAFRGGKLNRALLIGWNIFALILLVNVVTIAVVAMPSPMQSLALDQPNIAVLYFPFNWLPSVVVPIVLFCHLASLWKLLRNKLS
jgi:hypothetical protein